MLLYLLRRILYTLPIAIGVGVAVFALRRARRECTPAICSCG